MQIGKQKNGNPLIICKLFCPRNHWTWYLTEYYPETHQAYCYTVGDFSEWGYISITELERIKGRFGLGIERDAYFGERFFYDLKI